MADKKISQLTASTTPLAGTEELAVVQSGATKKVSVANLTAGRSVSTGALTSTTGTFSSYARVTGEAFPSTGAGMEITYNNGSVIRSYDRSGSAYKPLSLRALSIDFQAGGSARLSVSSAGDVTVNTGNLVIGTSGKGIDFSADGIFSVAGAEQMRVLSTGVTVGASSLSSSTRFEVASVSGRERLAVNGNAGNANSYIYVEAPANRRKAVVFRSGGSDRGCIGVGDSDELSETSLFISASGNVGGSSPHLVIDSGGGVTIAGSLSKGSGSFKIDHPLKPDTHYLVHSFVEAPQADNIYRGKIQLENGKAQINIDASANMTQGTFVALNCNVQCFTSNESDWDAVRGFVDGNVLTIECQNESSNAMVSWMVIGERCDQHMIDANWTDENGKVITEPCKAKLKPSNVPDTDPATQAD